MKIESLNSSWARRYIPGSAESEVKVPRDTEQICLNNVPGRYKWTARFRHPVLQEGLGKRPTRSKTYRHVITEHQSFQIVVKWLWERYSTVWNLCKDEVDKSFKPCWPTWVVEAVADCAACREGSECAFMADLKSKSKTTVTNETTASATEGSDVSGAGTSATESSAPDTRRGQKKRKLRKSTLSASKRKVKQSQLCSWLVTVMLQDFVRQSAFMVPCEVGWQQTLRSR